MFGNTAVFELDILLHMKWPPGDYILNQPHHFNCPPVCGNKFLLLIALIKLWVKFDLLTESFFWSPHHGGWGGGSLLILIPLPPPLCLSPFLPPELHQYWSHWETYINLGKTDISPNLLQILCTSLPGLEYYKSGLLSMHCLNCPFWTLIRL